MLTLWPAMLWACVYPAPVRAINTTLLEVLNGGGKVSNHQRTRLQRAMAQIAPGAVTATLRAELSRRDARAVGDVIAVAALLADGIGLSVDPDVRTPVTRVRDGIQQTCAQDNAQRSGNGEDATSAEHGLGRNEGAGGRGLTFGEGVARLSLTFTIYMTFLAFLLGIRRFFKEREAAMALVAHGQAAHVSPEVLHPADVPPSPADPASAMPPPR
ncbi:hypothetical protein [uncultured Tateyamaria sp.]|uniref:hypothetical protein n=1 Tax=Tateyamaria sp. 1078 TaxID=3417464 RepID=UPI0026318C46|nr:hypothetical protein [uncultured Tateyamaria sp.]